MDEPLGSDFESGLVRLKASGEVDRQLRGHLCCDKFTTAAQTASAQRGKGIRTTVASKYGRGAGDLLDR